MFWSEGKDLRNQAVYEAMHRDRFDTIMKSLHLHPNTDLDKDDKYNKLRPLIAHLQRKFMEHFVASQNICRDEAMIEYFGKHGCKQAIRNKPVRFGYKVWCQNLPLGCLLVFDLYQGKTYHGNEEIESKFGKSASTVLHWASQYSNDSLIAFSFLFRQLVHYSSSDGKTWRKRIQRNRHYTSKPHWKNSSLENIQYFQKKERGHAEVATATINGKRDVVLTRWRNNAVVTVSSTIHGKGVATTAKPWSKAQKQHSQVPVPTSIQLYNANMGGTDRMDQNINAYRIGIRGKKWWWSIFAWLVDVSIQNAWQLHRLSRRNTVSHLNFRRDIAMAYLSKFKIPPKAEGK